MNRTQTASVLILTTCLIAAACSGGDDETAPTTESAVTTDAPVATTEPPATTAPSTTVPASTTTTTTIPDVLRMPLTGEPIDDESEIPDRPALVVKISNAPLSVVPQAGLNNADIVFEEVINDSATRLAAVFHSQEMDPVGPIRSGRAQDINLLLSLQRPLFSWSGGNPSVTRAIRDSDLVDLADGRNSGFYRRSGRKAPNNLYTSTEVMWAQDTDETGRPNVVFPYVRDGESLPTGLPATTIEVTMDSLRVIWTYDEETDGYFREQNGREHTTETPDGVEPVWVRNVVVMMADYGVNTFDGNPDAQVLGANPVFVFTGGIVQAGQWLRFEPEHRFEFFDNFEDLNPLPLQPGRTWLEIPRNRDGIVSWEPAPEDDSADEASTDDSAGEAGTDEG